MSIEITTVAVLCMQIARGESVSQRTFYGSWDNTPSAPYSVMVSKLYMHISCNVHVPTGPGIPMIS